MLKKNFLASDRCYANYCHTDILLKKYEEACIETFVKISKYEKSGLIKKKLNGPIKTINFKG